MDFIYRVFVRNRETTTPVPQQIQSLRDEFFARKEEIFGVLLQDVEVHNLVEMIFDGTHQEAQWFLKSPSRTWLKQNQQLVRQVLSGLASKGVPVIANLRDAVQKFGVQAFSDVILDLLEFLSHLLARKDIDSLPECIELWWQLNTPSRKHRNTQPIPRPLTDSDERKIAHYMDETILHSHREKDTTLASKLGSAGTDSTPAVATVGFGDGSSEAGKSLSGTQVDTGLGSVTEPNAHQVMRVPESHGDDADDSGASEMCSMGSDDDSMSTSSSHMSLTVVVSEEQGRDSSDSQISERDLHETVAEDKLPIGSSVVLSRENFYAPEMWTYMDGTVNGNNGGCVPEETHGEVKVVMEPKLEDKYISVHVRVCEDSKETVKEVNTELNHGQDGKPDRAEQEYRKQMEDQMNSDRQYEDSGDEVPSEHTEEDYEDGKPSPCEQGTREDVNPDDVPWEELLDMSIARSEGFKRNADATAEGNQDLNKELDKQDSNKELDKQHPQKPKALGFFIPLSGSPRSPATVPYSGSLSLRSDSSTTSTRSFAFPVLSADWNSSPVKMAPPDRKYIQRRRRRWLNLLCLCSTKPST